MLTLLFINLLIFIACSDPLGMENKKIKDSQITVSSNYDESDSGKTARLHTNIPKWGAWCPNITNAENKHIIKYYDEYIQIDLLDLTTITKVATQGRSLSGGTEYVKSYQISYSYDNRDWIYIMYYTEKSSNVKVNMVKTGQCFTSQYTCIHCTTFSHGYNYFYSTCTLSELICSEWPASDKSVPDTQKSTNRNIKICGKECIIGEVWYYNGGHTCFTYDIG